MNDRDWSDVFLDAVTSNRAVAAMLGFAATLAFIVFVIEVSR